MKKKFKLKKRYLILNAVILSVILFILIYVSSVGRTYTLTYNSSDLLNEKIDISRAKINVEGDAVEFNKLYYDGDMLKCDLRAKFPGSGTVEITYEKDPDIYWYSRVITTPLLTIYDVDYIDFTGSTVVMYAIHIVGIMILLTLIFSIAEYIRKSNYCYALAASLGAAIFLTIMVVFQTLIIVFGGELRDYIRTINSTALLMMAILMPVTAVLCVFISISNLVLIKHEGFRFTNLLGVIVSIAYAAGTITYIIMEFKTFFGSSHEIFIYQSIELILVYLICYMQCMLIACVTCSNLAAKHRPPFDRDYIMILGCGIMKNGRLTPLLKARSVAALDFEKEQYEKTGKHAVFIPSGGQGGDEIISESEAIKRYLVKKGIPEDRIIMEDRSVNTLQNLQFSKDKMDEDSQNGEYRSAFSTTSYHVFRGYVLANSIGMKTQGISAKTKWYFAINAFLREFAGLIYQERKKHILVFLNIVIFILIVNFLLYM